MYELVETLRELDKNLEKSQKQQVKMLMVWCRDNYDNKNERRVVAKVMRAIANFLDNKDESQIMNFYIFEDTLYQM